MLHSLTTTNLPRPPRDVKLLQHSMGGIAIATITYSTTSSPVTPEQRHYFSLLEVPLPGGAGQRPPPRLHHLRSPHPAMPVTSVTALRSTDGDAVHLIVQCAAGTAAPETFLYRRRGESSGADEETEAEAEPPTAADPRVHYQRLPCTIDTAGRAWTATVAVATTENAAPVQPGSPPPRPLLIAASGSGLAGADPRRCTGAVQWVEVTGPTRARVVQTLELPALATFAVTALVPVPGSGGQRVLLLCHHAVVEVAAPRPPPPSPAGGPAVVVSNAAICRTWKWSPHDRLTACALKGYTLCAGTEDGRVVLWDVRQGGSGGEPTAQGAGAATASVAAATAAVTGLCAPATSSGFVTCALDGLLLSWQSLDDDEAAAALARRQQQQLRAARGEADEGLDGGAQQPPRRGAGDRGGALVSERGPRRPPAFPFVAAAPGGGSGVAGVPPRLGALPGTPGCVAMAADGALLAVGRDLGQLEVYLCS